MNPGYAGRSELPDNLKALFRPVAMMIPDYRLIAQISLYSFGFREGEELSLKIQQSLKLASEQVSSQKHYDFGMRAIKSIISSAGQLKREFPDEEESELVLKAIIDINIPKLTYQDVPLFTDILSDLFPNIKTKQLFDSHLMDCILRVAHFNHLTLNLYLLDKIQQLYQVFRIRHGLMLVGQTLSSKSTIFFILHQALSLYYFEIAQINYLTLKHQNELNIIGLHLQDQQNDQGQNQDQDQDIDIDKDKEQDKVNKDKIQYQQVRVRQLNPKSVSLQNLYGYSDSASNEFKEGVAASIFREVADDISGDLQWIVFDGPVDALWIENLNTVLDDNKKLCLPNGETIRLTKQMSIFFEAEDLHEASPATVSRCGMIFMESHAIEYQFLLTKWISTLPITLQLSVKIYIPLLDLFLPNIIKLLFQNNSLYIFSLENISQQSLLYTFFKVLELQLLNNLTKQQIVQQQILENEKNQQLALQNRFDSNPKPLKKLDEKKDTKSSDSKLNAKAIGDILYSILWSFGVMIEEKHRQKFELQYRDQIKLVLQQELIINKVEQQQLQHLAFNEEVSIFDVYWDQNKLQWNLFMKQVERIDETISFNEIYVKTIESQKIEFILKRLLDNQNHVLLYGITGNGKTSSIKRYLKLNRDKIISTESCFTGSTTCDNTMNILETKIEKQKRRKGVFGPLIGFVNLIFIDDINMPIKKEEDFGAQPAIELIRQWMDQGGWYDIKTLEFKTITEIQFVSAMGLGRPQISNRLLRHFNIIYICSLSKDSLFQIVNCIFQWGFNDYLDSVQLQIGAFSNLIVDSFSCIQQQFLPLPKKIHYVFNLRDILKVVQGMMSVPKSQYSAMSDSRQSLIDIFCYESQRVYMDRLVDREDQQMFKEILQEQVKNVNTCIDIENEEWLDCQYGNFMSDSGEYNKLNMSAMEEKIVKEIKDYNDTHKKQIEIVLFKDAQILLCQLSRILQQVYGHALLVGIGGVGRKTMTRLACYIQSYTLYDLEDKDLNSLQDWDEHLKEIIKHVALKNKPLLLLINQTDIKFPKMLQDINLLLNTGEIPSLFLSDEKEQLLSDFKDSLSKLQQDQYNNIYDLFVQQTRINLHIVLCLSPVGNTLQNTFKNYPSLVTCTNIIWTQSWSPLALYQVAQHFLTINGLTDNLNQISQISQHFHLSVRQQTINYQITESKYYYVTPQSYKNLLNNFLIVYNQKIKYLTNTKNTYQQGVQKLIECNQLVLEMKLQQENLKPILEEKSIKAEEFMKIIEVETEEAEKQKNIVLKDEEITAEKVHKYIYIYI